MQKISLGLEKVVDLLVISFKKTQLTIGNLSCMG